MSSNEPENVPAVIQRARELGSSSWECYSKRDPHDRTWSLEGRALVQAVEEEVEKELVRRTFGDGDSLLEEARRLKNDLIGAASERAIAIKAEQAGRNRKAYIKSDEMDERACRRSAEMLRKLATEVTRLRLGIQHYAHGRLSQKALLDMARSWNDA